MMIRVKLRVAIWILAVGVVAAGAQNIGEDEDADVLTAHDNRGNISSIYNLFDGQTHSIQVTRLDSVGNVYWQQQHYNGYYQKAYAAVMDDDSNLFIAGVRRENRSKFFWVVKFDENGYMEIEVADTQYDCTAVAVGVDRDENVAVAGVCRYGNSYPARLLRFDNNLGLLWFDEYDAGGRNYVRDMQVDGQGNVSLTVETLFGNYRDGNYQTRTIIYDPFGRRIDIR